MSPYFKVLKSAKGLSLISIIIFAALVFAGLNAYSYFDPDFTLNKVSVVYWLREFNDRQRKADLEKIQAAVDRYYDENGEYPAFDGWCGRIVTVLHPDAKNAINPYFEQGIPQDPSFRGTHKDYFYAREDRRTYVLMAVLENVPADTPTYNYTGCFDWPGNGVYNYQITSSR